MRIKKIFYSLKNKFLILITKIKKFFKKLLNPWYLLPVKIVSYTCYYIVRFIIKLIVTILSLIFEILLFPFRSLKHFFKALLIIVILAYIFITSWFSIDYIQNKYGNLSRYFCTSNKKHWKDSVVRIIGGYSQGTGFFVSEDTILTNFHVIAGEPSPKIIFSDGSFVTAKSLHGNELADLAVIKIDQKHLEKVMYFQKPLWLYEGETLYSVGFPGGTSVLGEATILEGKFIAFRYSDKDLYSYIHVDMNIAKGMSGGPLVNNCGEVVGITTSSLTGNSFFISSATYKAFIDLFSDRGVVKIELDPSKSPEEGVKAFYTYLKVRDMEAGFNLLSSEYLERTNFEEWTSRFTDILDVNILTSERESPYNNVVFVKFSTKNWTENKMDVHYYEGTWDTVFEDGVYKMREANIIEVENPDYMWFWEN